MADLHELERRCIEQIREIQELHRSELEPLMRHLDNIRSLRPPPPIIVSQETYDRFIAMTPPTDALVAPQSGKKEDGCICHGNWRAIVKETEHLIGKRFRDGDNEYRLFGVVHGGDDYYYGMQRDGEMRLLSCVASIEQHGFEQVAG